MYTKVSFSLVELLRRLWMVVLFMVFYTTILFVIFHLVSYKNINIPLSIPTVLGTAISLMLGFRTNAAYNRWWEARQVWGSIVNDSRTLIRQAQGFIAKSYPNRDTIILKLAQMQIAFNYTLSNDLRKLNTDKELDKYLTGEEKEFVKSHDNQHNAILLLEQKLLSEIYEHKGMHTYQFTSMDQTLKSICDSMGKCERIKNTVFPVQYGYYLRYAIFIFMCLLPIGLMKDLGILVIPVSMIVVFFFAMIDAIAKFLQDPFENKKSDTPMTALCRTIEINLLQMSGQKNVPKTLTPDKAGILM